MTASGMIPTEGLTPAATAAAITVGVLVVGAVLPWDVTVFLSYIAFGALVLTAWIRHSVAEEDAVSILLGVFSALTLRATLAWQVFDDPLRFSDTRLYWMLGTRIATLWERGGVIPLDMIKATGTSAWGYYYWVALHMLVVRTPVLLAAANAIVGAAAGVIVYFIGRHIWTNQIGRWAAWLVWLSSSQIVLDAHMLRDTGAMACGVGVVWGALLLADRLSWRGFLWYGASLLLLVQLRSYIAMLIIPVSLVGVLIGARRHRLVLLIIIATGGVAAGLVLAQTEYVRLLSELGRKNIISDMLYLAQVGLSGVRPSTSYFSGVHLSGPREMLLFLPLGMARELLAPLPWLPIRMDIWLIPEGLVRWVLIPLFAVGVVEAARRKWRAVATLLLVMAAEMALYAIIELGGNVRHNTQFFPFVYLFSMIGFANAARYRHFLWVMYGLLSLGVWTFGITVPFLRYVLIPLAAATVAWLTLLFYRERNTVAGEDAA
jgi:hypothetical protein